MLNQLLGGHYLVVQALGEGGLAKTYIAEDHHRPGHPKCAVKYLKPASNDPGFLPTARRLFNKEAEILEKLGQHSQIPRLLAYFEENKEFYLVQEFIKGHTLSIELPTGHCWSENKVIQMLQDVLPTLEFVHSYRVIHRDIKPSNLIRRQKDGRLVLIDFGAVKQVRDPSITTQALITQKTISIGTQGYIPTEQVRGKPRLNSDIYALGIIGIQALTGIDPVLLQEDAEGEIIWQNQAEVNDELAAILAKMVRYHFKERYQSVTEVLHALEPLVNYYKLIQPTSDTGQTNSEVVSESKLRETKVSLNQDIWNLKAISKVEMRETKVSIGIEHPDGEVDVEPESQKKTDPDIKQQTPKVVIDEEKKVSFVSPAVSLAPSEDSASSQTNIFVHLNKYRLLIGAGILSVVFSIVAGYTYKSKRSYYLQLQITLEQIELLKTDKKYQKCLERAQTFPQDYADLQAEVEILLNQCQQGQAEEHLAKSRRLAEQSKFKDAIAENDQQVELKSDKGIDYTELRNYLEAGNWKEADLETYRVMSKAAKGGDLTEESIKKFSCNDLKTINSLWQNYSNDRFGFSIQNNIYQDSAKFPNALGDKIGWRKGDWMSYGFLWEKFNQNVVPVGHLPARVFRIETGQGRWSVQIRIGGILDRTNNCNL